MWWVSRRLCGGVVAHVILVSPQSQLDFWIFDWFSFGIGIGSRGTGLGTRAWQYCLVFKGHMPLNIFKRKWPGLSRVNIYRVRVHKQKMKLKISLWRRTLHKCYNWQSFWIFPNIRKGAYWSDRGCLFFLHWHTAMGLIGNKPFCKHRVRRK